MQVTIETAENGYILNHGDRVMVATTLNSNIWSREIAYGRARIGKSVLELLEEIFEPPEMAEPVAPALKPLEAA